MIGPSLCEWCKHLEPLGRCKAFPSGIPEDVYNVVKDHRRPIRGDHGVHFELRSDLADPEAVLALIAKELPLGDEVDGSRQTA
jgi:hypothetical protein